MRRELIEELYRKREEIGRVEEVKEQRETGKLTARERIEALLDPGSFVEINPFVGKISSDKAADGVVTGYGTMDGRPVAVYAQVMEGCIGEMHGFKIAYLLDFAMKIGIPVIGLNDSVGARIQEGVNALRGCGEIFYKSSLASGIIPQINVIMGPCTNIAAFIPTIGDFVVMTKNNSCYAFVVDPQVIKAVTDEGVSPQELGGWEVQAVKSGNAHLVAEDDLHAAQLVRKLVGYLPLNNLEDPPAVETGDNPARTTPEIYDIIPDDPHKPYDVRDIIRAVVDKGEFFEIHELFAPNVTVGFARMDGRTVGIVANNPKFFAGTLDINGCNKIARFVRFCDAFNIPILTFVDVPGFLPGVQQEHGGIMRYGAKVLYAYSEATVPLITLILRKAYGGAYIAMGSKHLGADVVYAYPTAEIAVTDPESAVNVAFKEEIESAKDPEKVRENKVREYRERFANPYRAASRGYVDDVIDPKFTRVKIISALRVLDTKREKLPPKKHGNIPL